MIVYFSGTARNIEENAALYRQILRTIRSLGHLVAYDRVEMALMRASKKNDANIDWPGAIKKVEAGIEGAELVVAEASAASAFGVGYEVALALQKRKPVLVLVKSDNFADSYAAGISNDLLTVKQYEPGNVEEVVREFIKQNAVTKKDLRFNFVIDRQLHNHLRLQSFKTGKTKAELVRGLLLRDMGNDN